jgi:predicted ATP-grasp superfamily ATP-dependent carboligase
MRIGAFELIEPVPVLDRPHALTIIPSWLDAGESANLTLSYLEQYFRAEKLAKLSRPGDFFDYTRYRPLLLRKGNATEIALMNAVITYARREEGCDFLFLRLPEPHSMAEQYIDSVIELFKHFGVQRYGLLGAVYDMVPYTRPLMLTGYGSNQGLKSSLEVAGVLANDYEGPTTILHLIGQQMPQLGIETFSSVIHLPNYQTTENDHRGEYGLMEVMESLYGVPVPQGVAEKAKEQETQFKQIAEQFLEQQPQLKVILKQLEDVYDARIKDQKEEIHLSPEVEKFLKELNGRFEQG